jgi:P-type Ca2+ transporter type 2C
LTEHSLGLSVADAAERLKREGFNELPTPDRRGFLRILSEVVREPMFALLIGGGIVYLLLGDRTEALLLLVFACFSVAITIVQESRSERGTGRVAKSRQPACVGHPRRCANHHRWSGSGA